jgi:hypothetical protein
MKITLTTLVLLALLLLGCSDDSTFPTSSDSEFTQQSNSPNYLNLPTDLREGLGVETEYSAEKLINGDEGGVIYLFKWIRRPGHQFGNFFIWAKVKVDAHSFPDNEQRLFTITMDPDYAYLNITPSPNTLFKHIEVDFIIKGIDVTDINPETFDFYYIGDNNEMLETSKNRLRVYYNWHKIQLEGGIIFPTTPEETLGGTRYAFVR